jgi:Mg-chelatase subunit ChlD
MKTKIIALSLFAFTGAAVAGYNDGQPWVAPPQTQVDPVPVILPTVDPITNQRPKVDVVFALDTTGSMDGLIAAAKEKIWSIATTLASSDPAPEIRIGLVAYRDRGDAYVTKVTPLSNDLDSIYATLMDFKAKGGGDGPESVNQALYDAVHGITWSQDPNAYKVVFLIGDAPPHMDYQDDVKYPATIAAASAKGIVINAVQAGQNDSTKRQWTQIAQLGDGTYFQVGQSGNAVALATPFDRNLAELSAELDSTRLYYGNDEEMVEKQRKMNATDKLHAGSSLASRARRATFNASKSGEANLFGEGELVDDVASGRVDLSDIEHHALPEPIQAMTPAEQKALIKETAAERKELQSRIDDLAEQRNEYLKKKVEEMGGAKDSLDHKIYGAIREQAASKGLHYDEDNVNY